VEKAGREKKEGREGKEGTGKKGRAFPEQKSWLRPCFTLLALCTSF